MADELTQPPPTLPTSPTITVRYRSTLRDRLRAAAYLGRRSDFMFGLGIGCLVASAGSVYLRDPGAVIGLLVAGIALVTGWFFVPFAWWEARQRRDLIDMEVEDVIDANGIRETTPKIAATLDWSVYQSVTETRHAFYLSAGTAHGWIPKRAFNEADEAVFRSIVIARDLLRRPSRRRRLLFAVAIPLTLGVIGLAMAKVSEVTANPQLDLAATVDGRTVTIHGTTDIPDGGSVSIELIHVEQYSNAVASGAPASTDSPWVRYGYFTVSKGAVDAVLSADGWPAGRIRVVAFFSLSFQPPDIIDRYGARGEHLSGPWIEDDDADGRYLRTWVDVTVQ